MMLPPRPTTCLRRQSDSPSERAKHHPTTTSGTHSQAPFRTTYLRLAVEPGRRYLETGRRIRSFTHRSAPPVNVVTGLGHFSAVLSGSRGGQRQNHGSPGCHSGCLKVERRQRNGKQSSGIHHTSTGAVAKRSGAKRPARILALRQVDLTRCAATVQTLWERLSLQARADFFNIFNHPNFGPPTNYLSSPLFGQSTQMLGASLGSGGQNGGLNPLYQIGGPRSAQLALKLLF